MSRVPPSRWRSARVAARTAWRACPLAIVASSALTLVAGVSPAVSAWSGKLLFDELGRGAGARQATAVWLAVVASGAGAAAVITALAAGHVASIARKRIAVGVETDLFTHLNSLAGIELFEDPKFLNRVRLAEQGAQEAPQAITQFAPDAVRAAITTTGFLIVLILIYPGVALLVLLSATAGAVGQLLLARRRVMVNFELGRLANRRLIYRMLLTDPDAAKEIRIFGIGQFLQRRMTAALQDANRHQLHIERRSFLLQLMMTLAAAITGVIGLTVVVGRAARGQLSIGDVTLFIAALAAVQLNLSSMVVQYGTTVSALDQFGYFVEVLALHPSVRSGRRAVDPLRGEIVFHDVWFRYDSDGPWVLRGVTLVIPAGRSVGIVGLNGAGKSTLISLLCRFYDPTLGTISWDGTDFRELDVTALRERIRAVFQDFMRYDLTAAENVGIGDASQLHDLSRISRAASQAEVDQTLESLPQGYNTLLSRIVFDDDSRQSGVALSGGQWQRVALARSFMREDADVLILDEPSAGLDADGEHRVHVTLAEHRRGRTCVLVSHRLATLRDADQIVVLANGVVVEQGNHAKLISACGEYARLFALQARGYSDEHDWTGAMG